MLCLLEGLLGCYMHASVAYCAHQPVGYLGASWAFIWDCPWKMLMPRNFCSMHNLSLSSGDSTYLPEACSFHQGEQLGLNMVSLPPPTKAWQGFGTFSQNNVQLTLIHLTSVSQDHVDGTSPWVGFSNLLFAVVVWWKSSSAGSGLKKLYWFSRCGLKQSSGPGSVRSLVLRFSPRKWLYYSSEERNPITHSWRIFTNGKCRTMSAAGKCYCPWAGLGELNPFAMVFWRASCNPVEVWFLQ